MPATLVPFTPKAQSPAPKPLPEFATKAARLYACAPHACRILEEIIDEMLAKWEGRAR